MFSLRLHTQAAPLPVTLPRLKRRLLSSACYARSLNLCRLSPMAQCIGRTELPKAMSLLSLTRTSPWQTLCQLRGRRNQLKSMSRSTLWLFKLRGTKRMTGRSVSSVQSKFLCICPFVYTCACLTRSLLTAASRCHTESSTSSFTSRSTDSTKSSPLLPWAVCSQSGIRGTIK